MKNLLVTALTLFLLFQVARSQTPGDSAAYFPPLEYPSFKENYNAHAAYVGGNQWTTSLGNRPMGRGWKEVADEFELSPEGKAAYQLAQAQRRTIPFYSISGLALTLGSLPLLVTSPNFDWQKGIGLGMLGGGLALSLISNDKRTKSANNFQEALWLRNRDALLQSVPPTDQPRFKYLYESETIYLATKGYIKNGHKQGMGILGGKAAKEFVGIPGAIERYRKYRNNQRLGALLYVAGLATMVASLSSRNGLRGPGLALYIGGSIVTGAGSGVLSSSVRFLSQAIYLRNYNVIERQMLRQ